MSLTMDDHRRDVFQRTLAAMAEFKRVFGKTLSADFIAELYVATHFELDLSEGVNQAGYDAISAEGVRYQVKNRAISTQNVDINNFNFDYLVLVNLDENYQLIGMWRITTAQAQEISVFRQDYRKYQVTQTKIKAVGERIQ
jgi:hypothetical protein